MKLVFWFSILSVMYCYFGYPILLNLIAKVRTRPVDKSPIEPAVSVVISVYNEKDVIEKKINNLLSLDYPKNKMEILLGSDGSSDSTNDIIKSFTDERVKLFEHSERRGKMAVLNELVSESQGEIIVFNDARQTLGNDAIKQLVANFNDPTVGCVSGELMFTDKDGGTAKGVNLYWRYEKFMRKLESQIHSMLGATGAIYAIRRSLYESVPTNIVLDDMFIPFSIIKKGYRAVFDGSAKAYDEVADDPKEEHRRKARTLFGNYQIFGLFRSLFVPLKSPVSIQFFSHKLLRVVVPFLLLVIFAVNMSLLNNPIYNILFYMQVLFYGMAFTGGLVRQANRGFLKIISKACYVPYVFCLLNFSALVGFIRFIGAKQDVTWSKARAQ